VNLVLEATLVEGPPLATDTQFPSGTTTVPFWFNAGSCTPKQAVVSTGAKVRALVSPAAFVTLSGVGPTDDVTQAHTVYVRVVTGGFQLRLTFANPLGAPIVSILPLAGVFVHEPDALGGYYCTKIELQGTGTVEYFAAGLS
jgi:hypothetical protein